MIVRPGQGVLHLITQPDHARLAHGVMVHCVPLAASPRRDRILRAIARHDDGWAEEDAAPRIDTDGKVVDFINAAADVRQRVWPRAVTRLAGDPWAAALVAQHAITIFDRFRTDAAWTPFFAEMETMRATMMQGSGLAIDDLVGDYAFLRLADLISLAFCTGWTDAHAWDRWTVQLSGTQVGVTPDAFGGMVVPVAIDAKELAPRPFRSDSELQKALRAAPTRTLHGTVA